MSVLIGHASIGERGARGNAPGDQTGKEVCVRTWYDKDWLYVFRHPNRDIAEKIAHGMEQVCANPNIGYCQDHRTTMLKYAKEVNYDYSLIKTPCEVDCSSLVGILCKGAGLNVSENIWTGNEREALEFAGFRMFTTADYRKSDRKLRRGDILLSRGHTAVVLQDGDLFRDDPSKYTVDYAMEFTPRIAGTYNVRVRTYLSLRTGASESKTELVQMKNNTKVRCYGYHTGQWYLVVTETGLTGFCFGRYLEREE